MAAIIDNIRNCGVIDEVDEDDDVASVPSDFSGNDADGTKGEVQEKQAKSK